MSLNLSYLIVTLVGLLLYFLSIWVPQAFGNWKTPGLILFGVGLFYWLPAGAHALSIR